MNCAIPCGDRQGKTRQSATTAAMETNIAKTIEKKMGSKPTGR
jgi:hypothetical protein